MTDISTFLAALSVLLNVPSTMVAIDLLLGDNRTSLKKDEFSELKKNFELLKDHISNGSKIRNEIELWKQVHDSMTSFIEVAERVGYELNHPSGFHLDEAKRIWKERTMKATLDDINMNVVAKFEEMVNEELIIPDDPNAFFIAIENDYRAAVIHKNQAIDFWHEFQDAKSNFEREIQKKSPDSDGIRGHFEQLGDNSRSIIKRANSVLISLLNILKYTFLNLAKVKK